MAANSPAIFYPLLVQVFLTLALYVLLAVAKQKAVARGEVDEARRALFDDAWPESVRKLNNNLRNQFEVPVLFYALCLVIHAVGAVSAFTVTVAWLFALSRAAHLYVHVGSNHLPTRRRVFGVGCVLLLVLLAAIVPALIGPGPALTPAPAP